MSTAGDGEDPEETNEEIAEMEFTCAAVAESSGGAEDASSRNGADITSENKTVKDGNPPEGVNDVTKPGGSSGNKSEGESDNTKPGGSSSANHRNSESPETTGDNDVRFNRRRRSVGRQYRRSGGGESSAEDQMSSDDSEWVPTTPPHTTYMTSTSTNHMNWQHLISRSSSDSNLSMECQVSEDDKPTPKALLKCKPKHKWFAVREIIGRETGWGARRQGPERFQQRYYGSLHAVQRLELMYKLDEHRGCVNSLHFNRSGERLASASDDKRVVLWDWAADKSILSFDSGHTGNVFQAKFLPLSGDRHIVTCARDGQVRLSVLSGEGVCKGTRLLATHRRSTHKLAIHLDTPHVFLSAGEDALVLSHDVRTNKANKLLFVKENTKRVGLYSINSNPVFSNEFIVTGEDQYIRLYDKRKISEGVELNRFCPVHLLKPDMFLHVTCAVFNYNGTEVLGSYNDDDIYLFDTRLPLGTDYLHKYEGHRNSITVKGVNFFGPRSEFIVSGSDCGNIFFWDKNTEAIVQWMRGDEEGVVNCLEPHPQVPIIATSGLDNDIKIWVPSCEQEPSLKGLRSTVIGNQGDRDHSRGRTTDPFGDRQMWWLWRQIQRFEQRRSATNTSGSTPAEAARREEPEVRPEMSSSSSSSSDDDEVDNTRPQCSPS